MASKLSRVGCAFSFSLCVATGAVSQPILLNDSLALPVLISLSNDSTGLGFYLSSPYGFYLVTAKRVLIDPTTDAIRSGTATLMSYPSEKTDKDKFIFSFDLLTAERAGAVRAHKSADVVVVRVGSAGSPAEDRPRFQGWQPSSYLIVQRTAFLGPVGISIDDAKRFEDVVIANKIFVFGYPSTLGLAQLPQLDLLRPLLRSGIVAGVNPMSQSIVVDAPIYPGNSGGPVLQVQSDAQRIAVIGVVSEFVPFSEGVKGSRPAYLDFRISNSGYGVVTPMDFVLELLQQ